MCTNRKLRIPFVSEGSIKIQSICIPYNGAVLSFFDSFADFEYSSENLEAVLKNGPLLRPDTILDHTRFIFFPILLVFTPTWKMQFQNPCNVTAVPANRMNL